MTRAVSAKPFRFRLLRFRLRRRLFRRIMKETLPHHRALERLNDWLESVDELCASVRTRLSELGAKVEEAGAGLSDKLDHGCEDLAELKTRYLQALEDHLQPLREGLGSIAERYHPFCRRLLDELRSCFHSETEAALALVAA